jgi:peroxiredoxin
LVPDTDSKLSLLYGAGQTPTNLASRMTVFIDKQGIVRFIDRAVNVKTHGADVLARMKELGLGK